MKILPILSLFLFVFTSCNQPMKNVAKENTATDVKQNVVVENIMNRRSIRKFKPEQITELQLDTIIQCGINAPSALNKQSWEVRVIQNPELLNKINQTFVEDAKGKILQGSASRAQEPGFSVFHGAPTLIVVAKDRDNAYSAVDCGLFAENVLLSAESMNIGTCVVGSVSNVLNQTRELRAALNLPETHDVVFGISVGYADESPQTKGRDASKVEYIK